MLRFPLTLVNVIAASRPIRRCNHWDLSNLVGYTSSASWFHVFAVCSLSLSPAFALTMLLEMLPLRPPSEGWGLNWVYWLRAALSLGAAIQFTLVNPASGMTFKQALFMAGGTSKAYVIQCLVLAHTWRFSIPFSVTIGNPTWENEMYICAISKSNNPENVKLLNAAIPL